MGRHISWLDDKEEQLEKKVWADYSRDEVFKHLGYLTTLTRLAGTEDELKAAHYIRGKLEEYGVDVEIYEFDAYISHPGKAELEILSPTQKSFASLPHAYIASTPPEGVEAELISLGKGSSEDDYKGVDARGKIILINPGVGAGQADATRIAEGRGVAGQIHITPGRNRAINYMQLRETWGPPTPETLNKIPKTPVISICDEDGKYLAELTKTGRVVARLKADAWRGFKKIRFPFGTLKGMREPENYVLCGAHYCSWYVGATDNAAANSVLLEMARVFSKNRKDLRRSVKFAWWAGHSQGTFAGSSWYLDNFWEDVRDHAIAYLHMDGLGRIGADTFELKSSGEMRKFSEMLIKQVLGFGIEANMPSSKGGDQSFWGMGLPFFAGRNIFSAEKKAAMGGRPEWYAHTAEDTLDKVDMELLLVPWKVYSTCVLRLCNNPVLPFEFVTVADVFGKALGDLQKIERSFLDLSPLVVQAEELKRRAEALGQRIDEDLSTLPGKRKGTRIENKFKFINASLMELSRILTPPLYTKMGRYGHDPFATRLKPIPTLQTLLRMNTMDVNSEGYKALGISLLRERNKLSDGLHSANRLLDDVLRRA